MSTGKIEKIYKLSTIGYDDLVSQLTNINTLFSNIKSTKLALSKDRLPGVDTATVKNSIQDISKLRIEEQQLKVERQRIMTDMKAAQLIRQREIDQRRKEKQTVQEATGSYNALYREYKELNKIVKGTAPMQQLSFRGQTINYDDAITKLKQLAAAEQDFRRQFHRDGILVSEYTSGIVKAFKDMGLDDLIGGQITKANQKLGSLNREFQDLKQELSDVRVTGQGSLQVIEQKLIQNRQEALALHKQVGHLQNEFRGMGDIGNQITTSISKGFKDATHQIGQFILSYVGIQAVISGLNDGIGTAKELSDQTTNLEIELGKAAGGADEFVESLSKLNTRTKLTTLEDIANIALRAGTAEKNLASVTEAIDIAKVAFGKDFGDVESGTETFAKLIGIFYDDREITGDRILKIGNSIRTLANETVASVPYINDFTGRMAGLRQITNISLPDVIGLGAGFEEFKQSAEVSSTALVKVIPKLASDIAKYADITNVPIEKFRALMNENPAEALISVSEALVRSGSGIEDVAAALSDAELGAGRVTTILGTLGGKADVFRERISRAKTAISETSAITEAFNAKNQNLAATLDKISKKFSDAAGSKVFLLSLTAISSVVLFFLNNLPTFITLLTLWTIGWGLANKELLLTRANLLLVNTQLLAGRIALAAYTIVMSAYNAGLSIFTGLTRSATAATILFGNALRLLPLGIILTLLGLLAASFRAFGATVSGTTDQLRKQVLQTRIATEIYTEAAKAIGEQQAKLAALKKVVEDGTISLESRRKALQDLVAIAPTYLQGLTLQNIRTAEGKRILDDYNSSLLKRAELEASASRQSKEYQELIRLQTIKQSLEFSKAQKKGFGELSEDEKNMFSRITTSTGRTRFTSALINSDIIESDWKKALSEIEKRINDQTKLVDAAGNIYVQKQKEVDQKTSEAAKTSLENAKNNPPVRTAEYIKGLIKDLDAQAESAELGSARLKKLLTERNKLQDELDRSFGTGKKGIGLRESRLSAEQRDGQKDIDAIRDKSLADERIRRANNEVDEQTHLTNILKISQQALNQKLALLKGANAEERKQTAELKLELITLEQSTSSDIFKLKESELKEELDLIKQNTAAELKMKLSDQSLSETQRAQFQLDSDRIIYDSQVTFNASMDALEKQHAIQSRKNANERANQLRQVNEDIQRDILSVSKATLIDLQKDSDRAISVYKSQVAKQREEIITSSSLSHIQKDRLIDRFDKAERVGVLSREVSSLQQQLPIYRQLLEEKKLTEKEYGDFLTDLHSKQSALYQASTDEQTKQVRSVTDILREAITNGLKISQEYSQIVNDALSQSYSLAKDAMSSYFNLERNRIEESKKATLERLDIERSQLIARAQSKAEEQRIDQQYALKKKQAEKKAGEELKRTKKSEAKIALATELANIWATAYQLGPIGGPLVGGALSLLALGRYALRVNEINSAQFEFGGSPDVPSRGGKFGGKPHSRGGTPFYYKQKRYEAEVDELAIIRTKNASSVIPYTITGNHSQIASALNVLGGGRQFAPGAKIASFEYGGGLGTRLTPPVFPAFPQTSAVSYNQVEQSDISHILELAKAIQAVNGRIDRIEVVQDTRTVTNAQKKIIKQSNVGTL